MLDKKRFFVTNFKRFEGKKEKKRKTFDIVLRNFHVQLATRVLISSLISNSEEKF